MKTITTDKMTIGLVEVPDGAKGLFVVSFGNWITLCFHFNNTGKLRNYSIKNNDRLEITFMFSTDIMTEERATNIVDMHNVELITFKDYQGNPWSYDNATESFNSLLTANGLDPSKNYAILEIKK